MIEINEHAMENRTENDTVTNNNEFYIVLGLT
jgi:hypothetical protein